MTKLEANMIPVMVNDIFQITEVHRRSGWIGCFVQATEIKEWGIQGFVCVVETHEKQDQTYIRLKYEEIEYIGRAVMQPYQERNEDDS